MIINYQRSKRGFDLKATEKTLNRQRHCEKNGVKRRMGRPRARKKQVRTSTSERGRQKL